MNKTWMGALAIATLWSANALAQTPPAAAPTPAGLWKNIDDKSGKPKALIRIVENGGQYSGRIEKLFREPGEEQHPVCVKCTGDLKDKPVIGMTMLEGIKQDGEEFAGGQILDPDNGKTYRCKLALANGGKTLKVRGYIGVPWIGRSQEWLRQE